MHLFLLELWWSSFVVIGSYVLLELSLDNARILTCTLYSWKCSMHINQKTQDMP